MYQKMNPDQLEFEDFFLPFSGKLRSDNRWVKLAKQIPWAELEEEYAGLFSETIGAPAKKFRIALGSLIIKERLNITDEETVEHIRETPYLQYFIGYEEYSDEQPFDPSMMVHFRKRITPKILSMINDRVINGRLKKHQNSDNRDDGTPSASFHDNNGAENTSKPNSGIMMIDASVAPADITYPTDLKLLNGSREKIEEIIDILHDSTQGSTPKPRTYRQKARRAYLLISKQRKPGKKAIRKAVKQQLQYIQRDLLHVVKLSQLTGLEVLPKGLYQSLLVIHEIYRQQKDMFGRESHSVDDRIVNIAQPHVRPIVRGKAGSEVEFGAKIALSRINGYHLLEELSWDNFNEATLLEEQIERYRDRIGCYPEAVLADKLYRNRNNLQYCKERGIRLSGPKLGRPGKNRNADRKIERSDNSMRNAIEGSFGTAKRRYGLNRIMTKLRQTSETSIALIVLVMNLEKVLRDIFVSLFQVLLGEINRQIFKEIWAD